MISKSPRSYPTRSALWALACLCASHLHAADFYVATTGSDSNPGTLAAPFLTLAKAKSTVRTALPTATSGINVFIRGGTYELSAPLEFGPLDSGSATVPIRYSGYLTENVELSGTTSLTPTWTTHSGNIMITNIGAGLSFEVLFANETQQILARYPNFDANTAILNGYAADAISSTRAALWATPTTGFVRGLHNGRWGGNSFKMTGMSAGVPTLTWVGDNNRGSGLHATYRMVENLFEELDAPGEWFYNKTTGSLYFYPPAGMNLASATLKLATTEELIRVVGTTGSKVKHLTFDKLNYTKTARTLFTSTYETLLRSDWAVARKGAIFMQNAENITLSNSNFERLGGNAIFISGYNRNHLITQNEFSEIGATCVNCVGLLSAVRDPSSWSNHKTVISDTTPGPLTPDYPKDITISYNHMENMGRFEKQTSGVNLSMSESITVSHNTIHGSARAGLNVCDGTWGGHLFEYNDVFDCVRETSDHGPFNSWGRDRFWSYLGYNTSGSNGAAKQPYAFLDAWKTTIIRNNRFAYGTPTSYGIDLDDGSSNYEIYNNLLLNTAIKLREGFGRVVRNNILLNHVADFHVWYDQCRDQFSKNIVFGSSSAYRLVGIDATNAVAKQFTIDYNLFYNGGGAVTVGFTGWKGMGYDANSVTADPLFNNPATLDYSVSANSPALALGFVNFPMNQFGKPGSPTPPAISTGGGPATLSDAEPLMGASAASIYDIGIQSATGAPDTNGVYLEVVPAGSYAASQGFLVGDVIRSINGSPITTKQSFWQIYQTLQPGATVSITRLRDQIEVPASFTKMTTSEVHNNTAGAVYTGTWSNQANTSAFNNDLRYNKTNGSFFEITFYGSGISFTSQKNTDMGNVQVYIDGVLNQTVSCYNATRIHQQTVFSVSGLTAGLHTLKAVNAEAKYQMLDSFSIAAPLVAPNPLVGHWKFDHSTGTTVADSSTTNLNGTVANGTWTTGINQGALDCNGTNTTVQLQSASFSSISNQITIAIWIYGDPAASTTVGNSIFHATNSAGNRLLNIHLPWSDSNTYWDAGNSTGYDRINKAAGATDLRGRWNHWVFTKDATAGTMKIYLNGTLWHSGTGKTKTITGITTATIGSQTTSTYYNGVVDDVRLYNTAMTDSEVSTLYSNSVSGYTSWWLGYPLLSDVATTSDPDGDGIKNMLEYVLGGDPTTPGQNILPVLDASGANFIFSFTRRVTSATDTVQIFQYGSNLTGWTNVNITPPTDSRVTLGTPSGNLQTVSVSISKTLAVDQRLFGRLKVE